MKSTLSMSKVMILSMVRDKAGVFFMLLFPLMFLLLFGVLFQGDQVSRANLTQVGDVEVLDALTEEQTAALDDSLRIEKSGDLDQAIKEVREGESDAVVWEEDGQLELRVSSAEPALAGSVTATVNSLVQEANLAATGQPPLYQLSTGQVEDDSVQAIQFFAPGLLGWAVAMGASFMSAMTLVSWRKKRLLRRLWLAPIKPSTVIGARVGVSLGLAMVQLAVFIGVAVIPYYGLQLTGHWWLSIPLVICGTLAFMAIGLLIGALAKTEDSAGGALQVVIMPMAFLSGSFFPTEGLPGAVQVIANLLPLKHLNEAMMSVLSQNGGWGDALPVMGILLAFAAVVTAIAGKLFRWDAA